MSPDTKRSGVSRSPGSSRFGSRAASIAASALLDDVPAPGGVLGIYERAGRRDLVVGRLRRKVRPEHLDRVAVCRLGDRITPAIGVSVRQGELFERGRLREQDLTVEAHRRAPIAEYPNQFSGAVDAHPDRKIARAPAVVVCVPIHHDVRHGLERPQVGVDLEDGAGGFVVNRFDDQRLLVFGDGTPARAKAVRSLGQHRQDPAPFRVARRHLHGGSNRGGGLHRELFPSASSDPDSGVHAFGSPSVGSRQGCRRRPTTHGVVRASRALATLPRSARAHVGGAAALARIAAGAIDVGAPSPGAPSRRAGVARVGGGAGRWRPERPRRVRWARARPGRP